MKYGTILAAAMAASLLFAAGNRSEACTNVIVTRGASADGSCLVSYAADSHWLYGELYFKPQADWATGSKLKVCDWDSGKYLGEIEQVQHTYKTIGNMNEHQLIIAETTFGGRHGLNNPDAIMDYGSLIYITLQRARTAREAIRLMDELTQEYGYFSEGESFSIADKEEAWIMEMVGKGAEKGSVWVARRIPDGYVSGHANQSRITTFPLDDPDNCLYSKDVISFARKMGWFDGKDEEFSFRDAYCPLDFGGLRGCEARVWSAFNILGKGKFVYENGGSLVEKDSYDYVDYAMGHNPANNMPLWIKPAGKVSVKDVADVMRDHYEGTPMDMTQDIGAGGNALPYRWRPMGFTYDGKEYTNERAIATQQTAFWFVGQSRGNYPDVLGGIIWFGTDDAATSYVTPIYTNSEIVPECFRVGNGDMLTYSSTSSFWLNNRVANACYKMYNYMAPFVREHIDRFENSQISEGVPQTDAKALELYNDIADKEMKKQSKKNPDYDPMTDTGDAFLQVKQYLTSYSVSTADAIFSAWKKMEEILLVKFIDGNVKAQNEDGTFVHSPESEHIPDGLTQPGYTDYWKEAVAHFHGETVRTVPVENK